MATAGTQYTVFGFDSRIDWKPTVFVEGFPETRLCSACGLVPSATVLLPCRHVLCNRCYDGHGDRERNCCPLDKIVWKPEDVAWSTFAKDNVVGRKVQCWNWSNGCNVVGTVCEIVDHFDDCQYHAVSCFRCKKSMPYKELFGHLDANDCPAQEVNTASISYRIPDATITLFAQGIEDLRDKLLSIQTCVYETKEVIYGNMQVLRGRSAVDVQVTESLETLDNSLKENLGHSRVEALKTATDLALISDNIRVIMNAVHDVETLVRDMKTSLGTSCEKAAKETSASYLTVQEKLEGLSAFSTAKLEKTEKLLEALQTTLNRLDTGDLGIKDSLQHLNERLSEEVCRNISVLGKVAKFVSGLPLCACEPLLWDIENWSYLKNAATYCGQMIACAKKPNYFFGYLILPGIKIVHEDGNLKVFLIYQIHQGGYDSLLNWPFAEDVHLSILNGRGGVSHYIKQTGKGTAVLADERPTTEKNDFVTCGSPLNLTDIERDWCVIIDTVSVKFTVSRL